LALLLTHSSLLYKTAFVTQRSLSDVAEYQI
jgi:hypothetical protein